MHKRTKRKTVWNDLHKVLPKSIPQSLSVGFRRHIGRRGKRGEREREKVRERGEGERERVKERESARDRLSKCWSVVCLGQTTEYTERENGLHSSSSEVQTVLRAKFSNILSAQVDKTMLYVRACTRLCITQWGRQPTYYCDVQILPAHVVSHLEQRCTWFLENTFRESYTIDPNKYIIKMLLSKGIDYLFLFHLV